MQFVFREFGQSYKIAASQNKALYGEKVKKLRCHSLSSPFLKKYLLYIAMIKLDQVSKWRAFSA